MGSLAAEPSRPSTSDGNDDDFEGDTPSDETARPRKPVNWPIQIAKTERTIFELHRSHKSGVLDLSPNFQREFVWSPRRQVKLVESVLARIPLPVVYLSEEDEDHVLVIDGQQRLTTLFRFLDGKLVLKDLVLLPEFEGKTFSELDGKTQRRFENTAITCFIVQPGTDTAVKFQIFERLNEGAVALNPQEIRNCLFRGPGLDMVRRLAADSSPGSLRAVAGQHRAYRRMKADEMVLRCLAFIDTGYEQYEGDFRGFLNDALIRLNKASPDARTALESRLRNALSKTAEVFGEQAFRRYDPQRQDWVPQLNAPLIDTMVTGFDRIFPANKPLSAQKGKAIRKQFEKLCEDPVFRDAITFGTNTESAVKGRIELWLKKIKP